MSSDLVKVEDIKAIEVFTGDGIDILLSSIESEVKKLVPDLTTAKGRKEIASMAHKVSKSKVVLDGLRKDLVTDWKQKAKQVDEAGKKARDFLDNLRDETRRPLTEWEEAEAKRVAAEELAQEILLAHSLALEEDSLFNRQKEIEAKEAKLARQEEERKAKEAAEQAERDRIANEERIRKEAEEKVKRDADEKAQKAAEEAERKIQEEREAKEKAERDRIAADERAKLEREQVERDRVAAEEKAKADQELAVQKAKEEAERKAKRIEDERIKAEADRKDEEEKKAANKEHQRKINQEALKSFQAEGINDEQAKAIIVMIASGKIANVIINY